MFKGMSYGGLDDNPESGVSGYAETLSSSGPDVEQASAELVERGESVEAGRSFGGAALSVSERLGDSVESQEGGEDEGEKKKYLDTMSPERIGQLIETLVSSGQFDTDDLVSRMLPKDVCDNCVFLLDRGLADAKMVAEKMIQFSPASAAEHLDLLLSRKNGGEVNIGEIVVALDSAGVAANLETLVSNGVGIEELVQKMDSTDIGPEQQKIIDKERGAIVDKQRIGELSAKMGNGEDLTEAELRFLYETERPIRRSGRRHSGAVWSPEEAELRSEYDIECATKAGISVDEILDSLAAHHGSIERMYITEHIDELIKCGASVEQLKRKIGDKDLDRIIEVTRLGLGDAEADSGGAELSDEEILLRRHGVDVDLLMSRVPLEEYEEKFAFPGALSYRVGAENFDALTERGYFYSEASQLAWILGMIDQKSLVKNIPTLIEHDAGTEWVAKCMGPNYRARNKEALEG